MKVIDNGKLIDNDEDNVLITVLDDGDEMIETVDGNIKKFEIVRKNPQPPGSVDHVTADELRNQIDNMCDELKAYTERMLEKFPHIENYRLLRDADGVTINGIFV